MIKIIILFFLSLLLLYQFILLINSINKKNGCFSNIQILDPKNSNDASVYHLTTIEPNIIVPINTPNILKYQINYNKSMG